MTKLEIIALSVAGLEAIVILCIVLGIYAILKYAANYYGCKGVMAYFKSIAKGDIKVVRVKKR